MKTILTAKEKKEANQLYIAGYLAGGRRKRLNKLLKKEQILLQKVEIVEVIQLDEIYT
jgi:hypothetical protein